jgi:hypothetical protein
VDGGGDHDTQQKERRRFNQNAEKNADPVKCLLWNRAMPPRKYIVQ